MLIKQILIPAALVLTLSGCASGCREACILGFGPGNAAFDRIALNADRADPCQAGTTPERREQLGRSEGYQRPDWCFSGQGYRKPTYIYNNSGQRIAVVK